MKKPLLYSIIIFSLSITTISHAYWWRLNNFTTKIILLKLTLLGSNNPYYAIVYPNMSTVFDWSPPNPMAGFCFGKLEWIEAPQEIINNTNLIDNYTVINNKKMDTLFHGKSAQFTLEKVNIRFFPSEIYKKTIQIARSLFGDKFIKWLAQQYTKSACKSRHIAILENKDGEIEFFTQK